MGIEAGIATLAARVLGLLPAARWAVLRAARTIDVDTAEVEVFGRAKQQVELEGTVQGTVTSTPIAHLGPASPPVL